MPKDEPDMTLVIGKKKDDGYGPMQSEKDKEYQGLEFDPPKGMDLEGHKDGDMIEMVGTFEVRSGKLCLKKVDGMDIDGDGKEEEGEDEEKSSSFTDAVMGGKEDNTMPEEEEGGM
jgi:hypothetical protein